MAESESSNKSIGGRILKWIGVVTALFRLVEATVELQQPITTNPDFKVEQHFGLGRAIRNLL